MSFIFKIEEKNEGKFHIHCNKIENKLPKYLEDNFEGKIGTKEELIKLIKKVSKPRIDNSNLESIG